MPQLTVAKPREKDFETTLNFLTACDTIWSRKNSNEEDWEEWDDEDDDKIQLLKIRKRLSKEDGYSESDIDNRLVLYEFLKEKFHECDCNWRRVYWAADLLVEDLCDPTESHLAYYPGLEEFHVANEQ